MISKKGSSSTKDVSSFLSDLLGGGNKGGLGGLGGLAKDMLDGFLK